LLIWVESNPIGGDVSLKRVEMAFSPGHCMHFHSAARFTRWLFDQDRGQHVVPHALLVVGPREAKPCAQALVAARTEDLGLRTDAKRMPKAPGVHQSHNIVVGGIVCVSENKRQLSKLKKWLNSQRMISPLPLFGVHFGIERLSFCLDEMATRLEHEATANSEHYLTAKMEHEYDIEHERHMRLLHDFLSFTER